jgi:VanZ family protein
MSHRTRLSWLALFCVACAAYGSFVPLRWRPLGWTEGFRLAVAMPVEPVWHLFNGDFFTNVLVFLPIGFFAAGAIARGRRSPPVLAVTGTVLTGSAVLSMLIELGQVFVRDRTPSWSDVYAQTLGGLAGAVLWTLIGVAGIEWVTRALRETSREERVLRLLGIYAAGWTALGLLPTVFPHLAHPQLHLWTARQNFGRLVLVGPLVIATLSAVPVGAYAALLCTRLLRRWAVGVLALTGVGLLVLLDRVRQVSFLPADGHLAAELLGFSSGWLMLGLGWRRAHTWPPALKRVVLLAGLTGLLAAIALQYWAPFDFGVSARALDQRVSVLYTRAPFHRYYWLPPLVALGELMTLALLALGTSLLIALAGRVGDRIPSRRTTVLATTIVFTVVEWGQLYLPGRRADPTDVAIAALGAAIGAVVAEAFAASPERPRADS